MKRAEQLQPPVRREPEVELVVTHETDPARVERIAAILLDIVDSATTPGKDGRT